MITSDMPKAEGLLGLTAGYKAIDVRFGKKAKYILYFKEMCHVTHSFTMARYLRQYLNLSGLRTRLVLYNRVGDFMSAYRDMQLLDSRTVMANHKVIEDTDINIDFVATDFSNEVIKTLLDCDSDVLIVFDRLGWREDLLTGSLVFKFNLAGSLRQMKNIEAGLGIKFNSERTFVEDVNTEYLYIPEIYNFNDRSNNEIARMAQYVVANVKRTDGSEELFDLILESCGITIS